MGPPELAGDATARRAPGAAATGAPSPPRSDTPGASTPNARPDLCPFETPHQRVEGRTIGRGKSEPGWRWSENVEPIAGTDSGQAPYLGYTLSGRMGVIMDDGSEGEAGTGDVVSIPPIAIGLAVGANSLRQAITLASQRRRSRPSPPRGASYSRISKELSTACKGRPPMARASRCAPAVNAGG
jgi:hypothetical protein